ncbi:MAG: heavy-metal-associated domain-containing protein [Bacteroidales bacterium]|nr:heavy-metal-associated domain-containing protein [Bacteroidales bacterium]
MKIFKILTTAIGILVLSTTLSAQHDHSSMGSSSNRNTDMNMNQHSSMPMLPPKTETLKVWGKCAMCKTRIEKIAVASSVTSADWNVKTKVLTVVYEPNRSSMDYISGKLAKAGHDTGLKSAKDKAYDALPDCCKYERIR